MRVPVSLSLSLCVGMCLGGRGRETLLAKGETTNESKANASCESESGCGCGCVRTAAAVVSSFSLSQFSPLSLLPPARTCSAG